MRDDGRASRGGQGERRGKGQENLGRTQAAIHFGTVSDGLGLRGLALAASFFGALAVSALVAMIVVNVVRTPTMLSADVSDKEHATKSQFACRPGDLARVSESPGEDDARRRTGRRSRNIVAAAPPNYIAASKPPWPRHARNGPSNRRARAVQPPEIACSAPSPAPTASAQPCRFHRMRSLPC